MARGPADIGNTAVRIFLQRLGRAYDIERGLPPYTDRRDFPKVREFFDDRCCYCGQELSETSAAQDHLIPLNKDGGGLHAWGNVVPACPPCNAAKHGSDWRDFLLSRAGADGSERHAKMRAFLDHYKYQPAYDLQQAAEELYEESIAVAMALVMIRHKRVAPELPE